MNKILTLFLLFALLLVQQQASAQAATQLGNDLDAEAANDGFGVETKFSADGQRLVVGAPGNRQGTSTANLGHARVYEWDGMDWVQLGNDIDGTGLSFFGYDVDISADGNRIIGGAYNSDVARVYEWDGTSWTQVGLDLTSNSSGTFFGFSVAMANNGNRVVVGAPQGTNNGNNSGYARIYDWNGFSWVQVDVDINGNVADKLGTGVSISEDGNYVITGAQDGRSSGLVRTGYVNVYRYVQGRWTRVGNSITGDAVLNENFGVEVDISDNGHVIGVADNIYGNNQRGAVQAFCWNGTSWQPRGSVQTGDFSIEALGSSMALSSDGNILMGGGVESGNARGRTRVYTWDGTNWNVRPFILGETGGDRSGRSSDVIVNNGTAYLAIGANFNGGTGINAGHARVFTTCAPVYIVDSIVTCNPTYTWLNGTTYSSSTEICSAPNYVMGTNTSGCDTIRMLILDLDPMYVPSTILTQSGNVITVDSTPAATYQWLDCSNNNSAIVGAINRSYTPSQSGQYAVVVTDNGCVDTSSCYSFTYNTIDVLANGKHSIQVYPNPTAQNFTINMGATQAQVKVRLMGLSGNVLQEQSYEQLLQTTWTLESSLPTGIYILSVQIGATTPVYLKVVKQ